MYSDISPYPGLTSFSARQSEPSNVCNIFKLRRIAFIIGYAFLLPLLMKRIIRVVINKVYISFFAIALDVCSKSPRLKVAKGNFPPHQEFL
jgi:hypothetical protein